MRITLTLKSAYTGNTDIGPFTVSGTTNGGSLNGVNMTTGSISRVQLTSGWGYDDLNDTITGGTINSSGTCFTGRTWSVDPSPTPTSTPIPPTPTAVVSYQYDITQSGSETRLDACNEFTNFLPDEVFAAEFQNANVTQFFTDSGLTQQFGGDGGYYCWRRDVDSDSQRVTAQVGPNGIPITAIQSC
jgi:hypothetical protein